MSSKAKGVISYIFGWLGGLIVLCGFKDNDRKTVIHACQAITISICQIAASLVFGVVNGIMYAASGFDLSLLSSLLSIAFFALSIIGLVKALKDDPDPKLPVIGDITMNIFAKKINATPESTGTVVPRFDPNTGQPINPQPQGNFDPNTGKPIQPQGNFDPNTGQPINAQPQANFDPNTGQPITTPETSAPTTPAN